MLKLMHLTIALAVGLLNPQIGVEQAAETPLSSASDWAQYSGPADLPGAGHRILLIAGDEEYRSEEALPMLGAILAKRHGFECTVLFSTDPESGEIDPMNQVHIEGLHLLGEVLRVARWPGHHHWQ